MRAELFLDCRLQLAEGPLWFSESWWWVDIEGRSLNCCAASGAGHTSKAIALKPGAAVPASDGRWLVAHEAGFGWFDWDSGVLRTFDDHLASQPDLRMNDGKCDPAGRFWAGSMHSGGLPEGNLYRVSADLSVSVMLEDIGCSNGLAWSADAKRMYYIDTPTRRVEVFDFESDTGSLSGRRTLVEIPCDAGFPDGMAIDNCGNVWVALWGGGAVQCYDGDSGALLDRVECGATQITSCCFGGPDRDLLLVTSARLGLSAAQLDGEPSAGSLWLAKPGVRGLSTCPFVL